MLPSDLVAQFNHPVPVRPQLGEVQGDVVIQALGKVDAVSQYDRHDGEEDVVRQAKAQALATDHPTADEPDAAVGRLQPVVDENGEVAGVEPNGVPGSGELAARQNEGRLLAVRPSESLLLESQRRLVGSRA